jgi:hypothetical protein
MFGESFSAWAAPNPNTSHRWLVQLDQYAMSEHCYKGGYHG